MSTNDAIFLNPHVISQAIPSSASAAESASNSELIQDFHHSLPYFNITPLISIPSLAQSLGVGTVYVKVESSRLGLPAFKILGASWGVYRALSQQFGLDPASSPPLSLAELGRHAKDAGVVLYAATDGNHGRAVARMAQLLDVPAKIYAPQGMYPWTQEFIRSEGAEVIIVEGDYDRAVGQCWVDSQRAGKAGGEKEHQMGVMVQDNAFDGYETVPRWIVDGYRTLLSEVDQQVAAKLSQIKRSITHVVTPIGVGSLGHAVVKWAKTLSDKRTNPIKVIAVEPATAACLNASLRKGESVTIETEDTIMSGMCCGAVSPTAWQGLKHGIDVSITVGDWECHQMVGSIEEVNLEGENGESIEIGPCGAGCLVGLNKACSNGNVRRALDLDANSVIVVLSTEGKRDYPVPSAT